MSRGAGRSAASVLLALVLAGCLTYTPAEEPAPASGPALLRVEEREIAASEMLLAGAANSFALTVTVPHGATAVRLEIVIEHLVGTGFRWSGLGACEGALDRTLSHESKRLAGDCGALAPGEYTLVVSQDGGVAVGRVRVAGDFVAS